MHDRRKRFCSRASFFLYKYPPSNVMICPVRYSGAQISSHTISATSSGVAKRPAGISSASSARSASSNCLFISVSMTPHARALTGILLLASSLASAWVSRRHRLWKQSKPFTGCTVYAPHGEMLMILPLPCDSIGGMAARQQ